MIFSPNATATANTTEPGKKKTASNAESILSKGTLISIPVVIKNVEQLSYVMRIGERMPTFNYWPRGVEIIHRLIMRAAMSDNEEDFRLYRTDDTIMDSLIFKDID